MIAGAVTKIVLLDDDKSFLDSIKMYLEDKLPFYFHIETFLEPNGLLEFVKDECFLPESPSSILDEFYSNIICSSSIRAALYDLSKIKGLLVIDQNLGGSQIKGTDIIKQIQPYYPSLKITLLTSVVDPEQAIELHNSNTIDVFINKESENAIETLSATLIKQSQYIKNEFQYDLEDAFPSTILTIPTEYLNAKHKILNTNNYRSFLTVSESGDIAILNHHNEVKLYKYNNKNEDFDSYDLN